MTDFGLPFSFSAFVSVGARPTRAAICFPLRRPSSGQVGDERCRDDQADTAHGAQDLGQAIEAWGKRRDDEGQALANERVVCQINAAVFGLPGVDKLSAPGGQRPQALVSARNVAGRSARPLASAR
jgi:hypothetical protein